MSGPRKLYVKSYGCQMNVYDSHRMADLLAPEGFVETAAPEDADLIILNTCHIREKAADKVYSELGRVRVLKEERGARRPPRDRRGRGLRRAGRGRGNHPPRARGRPRGRAAELSSAARPAARAAQRDPVVETEFPVEDKFAFLTPPTRAATRARGVTAFVTVQEGCDKFCTFCVVPYTRGAEVSRPVEAIIAEVRNLADAGVREVTLIGQNVNAYHGEGPDGRAWTLGRLLHRVAEVPGIARLRYTTSHPGDVDDDLIAVHRDLPQLAPQLHLPVQSGSDRILAAMNRRHTRADYLRVIERLRAGAAGPRALLRFHRRLPGRDRGRVPRHARHDRRGRLFGRLLVQIFAAARHARRHDGRSGCRGREGRAPCSRLQAAINRHQTDFNARCRGLTFDVLIEKAGMAAWPAYRPLALSSARERDGAR